MVTYQARHGYQGFLNRSYFPIQEVGYLSWEFLHASLVHTHVSLQGEPCPSMMLQGLGFRV